MTAVPDSEAMVVLKRLEPMLDSIIAELKGLRTDLTNLEKKVDAGFAATNERLARVEGQLTNIPSGTMLILTIMGGLVANGLVIAGVVFAVLSFVKTSGVGT